MDLQAIKKIINKLVIEHQEFVKNAITAEKYYRNKNDIKENGVFNQQYDAYLRANNLNPLRNADNRISHNWHKLLVDQKVSYGFSYPPMFDTEDAEINKKIVEVLGDEYAKVIKDLAADASNCGVAWLHIWEDENSFNYAVVDPKQVIPIYSSDLKKELVAVLRAYELTGDDGILYQRFEYWTDKDCTFFIRESNGEINLEFAFEGVPNILRHKMAMVPFIPLYNNSTHTGDLDMYKDLIDAYDKVVSGFANDLDDVQEVIFVISGYGDEDRDKFIADLKKFKTIKVDPPDGAVNTIRAEIPHEARNVFLEMMKKQIFISGMGVNPDPEKFGNASGVSLQFLYSLLELKMALTETEFRLGLAKLVRAILRYMGVSDKANIIQTWTRNAIRNDLEIVQMLGLSGNIISERTKTKNHPLTEDIEEELKQIEKERKELDSDMFQRAGEE
ncbi:MAG: phage portal protein [Clostridia bacterium]|nr:phage portal protein [Clostridia bacterium]